MSQLDFKMSSTIYANEVKGDSVVATNSSSLVTSGLLEKTVFGSAALGTTATAGAVRFTKTNDGSGTDYLTLPVGAILKSVIWKGSNKTPCAPSAMTCYLFLTDPVTLIPPAAAGVALCFPPASATLAAAYNPGPAASVFNSNAVVYMTGNGNGTTDAASNAQTTATTCSAAFSIQTNGAATAGVVHCWITYVEAVQ